MFSEMMTNGALNMKNKSNLIIKFKILNRKAIKKSQHN